MIALEVKTPGGFSGQFDLTSLAGTYWNPYTQTGALELSAKNDGIIGGGDTLTLIASGDAITFSSNYTWVNIGTDDISIVASDINYITVVKVSASELRYGVKVVTP